VDLTSDKQVDDIKTFIKQGKDTSFIKMIFMFPSTSFSTLASIWLVLAIGSRMGLCIVQITHHF